MLQELNQRQQSIIHDIMPAKEIAHLKELQQSGTINQFAQRVFQFRRDSVATNQDPNLRRASVVTHNFQGNITQNPYIA